MPYQAHCRARSARLVSVLWHCARGNLATGVRIHNYLIISELVLADGFFYRFVRTALRILAASSVGFALMTVGLIICERCCEGVRHLSQSIVGAPVKRE